MSFDVTLKHIELLKTYANCIFGNSLEKYIKTGNYTFSDIVNCNETTNITYIHIDIFDIYNLILSEYILNGTENLPSNMVSIIEETDGTSKIYNIKYKLLRRKVVIVMTNGKYISFMCETFHSDTTEKYFFKNSCEYHYSRHSKSGDIYEAGYKLTKLGMYYFLAGYKNKETTPSIKIIFDNAYNRIFYKSALAELDSLNVIDSNRINYNYNNDLFMFNITKGYNSFVIRSNYNSGTILYHIKNKYGIIKLSMTCKNNITEILSFRKNNKLYISDIG